MAVDPSEVMLAGLVTLKVVSAGAPCSAVTTPFW